MSGMKRMIALLLGNGQVYIPFQARQDPLTSCAVADASMLQEL